MRMGFIGMERDIKKEAETDAIPGSGTDNLETTLGLNLVNAVSQQALEQKIESNVQALSVQHSLEQEQARLERVQNLLEKLLSRRRYLERRYNNATRISVRSKIKEQIQSLEDTEIRTCKEDINDIEGRISSLLASVGKPIQNADTSERLEGESEREFLVRTGQITAFGSKTGFTIEHEPESGTEPESVNETLIHNEQVKLEDLENKYHEPASRQRVGKPSDSTTSPSASESDYVPEEVSNESESEDSSYIPNSSSDETVQEGSPNVSELKSKLSMAKDDGDEYIYQKRLKKWINQRSANRKVDKYPDLPEWRKPHPNIPDARLNDVFKIPGDIFPLLFNYQRTCVQWLYELFQQGTGGIIGDEMGLGKTIEVISFLASLHHSGLLNGPILIVCPATVMSQWVNELHHWWPPFRSIILHSMGSGMASKKSIDEDELEEMLINSNPDEVSYESLQNSAKTKALLESDRNITRLIDKVVSDGHVLITTYVGLKIHSDKLLKVNWAYAILDEGHKIRNPDADISLTCKKLKTPNRIILSGTPIQNNLNELWSLFDFIYPGKLGTLPVFQKQFVIPINAGGYANATNIQVQTGYKCAVALRDLISPYLLRRVKSDVKKDLPQKKEMVLFCKLTQFQRDRYLEFLHSEELSQIKKGRRQVLYGIDILRKICNHPDLLQREQMRSEQAYGDPRRSGKMQVVKQLLLLWHKEGHKSLLFTQSRQMLDILEDFISYKDPELSDIKYLRMDGTTGISKRQSLVDQFNNESYDLFLLTTRVGGLGVNLTGATRIIIFDPDWNPSTDMQARERAWRIGQKREVSIYRLMVAGSIEEKIYHRQIFKQFLSNKILKDPNQKRFFKMNELHDLFTLGGEDGLASDELVNELEEHTRKLMKSKTEESDDFEQVANIVGVSKLESFYNTKDKEEESKDDDDRLMDGLIGKNSNLEMAVPHEQLVGSHLNPNRSSSIIVKEASRIAQNAVSALRKSKKLTRKSEIGTPTWTGRFGQAGKVTKKKSKVGLSRKKAMGSADILANIRNAKTKDDAVSRSSDEGGPDENQVRLTKMEGYLKSQPRYSASSRSIIRSLGINPDVREDVIRSRALLKTIATFDKEGKVWILNKEFQE